MSERSLPLAVAGDHPAYAGHFPGRPILPGVVLLDAVLHALAAASGRDTATGQIRTAKFLSPVAPGEALRVDYAETGDGVFRFTVFTGARAVASGVFAFAAGAAA